MADERFKGDANFKAGGVVGGYSSGDAIGASSVTLIALRIDSTTGRLLVDTDTSTAVVDNEAVDATDTGNLVLGTDGSNYQILAVDSNGHLQVDILSGGGGTEYSEDAATPATISGLAVMMERDDALSTVTPAENDWLALRGTAEGALWTQDFNSDALLSDTNAMVVDLAAIEVLLGTIDADTGAIKTAVEVIDNAISGNEMQVDIVADGAGLATDAKLDTIITALQLIDDAIYVDDADWTDSTSKHMLVGGLYQSSPQTVTDGDVAPLLISNQGRLQVDLVGIPDLMLGTDFSNVFGTASLVDGSNHIQVDIAADSASLATSANQTTIIGHVDGIEGLLTTIDADTGAIKTAVEVIDNAISGNEMQVDLVGSVPAGTNVIGKVRLVTATGDEVTEDTDDSVKITIVADDVGIGGGTQYAEDAAHVSGNTGTMALVVRNDTLAALAGTDGDYAPLQVNASGALYIDVADGGVLESAVDGLEALLTTIDADTGAIKTAVELIDNAISGSEMQVDIVSGNVTNAGTFAVQVDGDALTALQLIDNIVEVEDTAHSSGDSGVMALAVRNDTLAALAGTDGDYAPLQVNASGALYIDVADGGVLEGLVDGIEGLLTTIDADTGAIKTAVEIIDNAISGSEMQVDVVASLPAGTNAIGKLAANSGVDIGDVDVTSIVPGTAATNLGKAEDAAHSSGDTGVMALAVRNDVLATLAGADGDYAPLQVDPDGALYVTGSVEHDTADDGAPMKIGGRAQSPTAAVDEVADNDRVDALFDRQGRLAVWMGYDVKSADINDATSGNNTIVAAAGAGICIAVIGYHLISDGTVDYRWEDGAGGTAFTGQLPLLVNLGMSVGYGFQPMWKGTANTLLNLELSAAVNVHGQVSYVEMTD